MTLSIVKQWMPGLTGVFTHEAPDAMLPWIANLSLAKFQAETAARGFPRYNPS
jgi:hypothetical protein